MSSGKRHANFSGLRGDKNQGRWSKSKRAKHDEVVRTFVLVERSIREASSLVLASLTVYAISNRRQDEPINLLTECQQSSGDRSWLRVK